MSIVPVTPMFWPRNPAQADDRAGLLAERERLREEYNRLKEQAPNARDFPLAGGYDQAALDRAHRAWQRRMTALWQQIEETSRRLHALRQSTERRVVGVVNPGGVAMRTNPHHRHRRRARRTRRNPDTLFTLLLMAAALVAGVALSRYGVVERVLPGDLEQRLFPGTGPVILPQAVGI